MGTPLPAGAAAAGTRTNADAAVRAPDADEWTRPQDGLTSNKQAVRRRPSDLATPMVSAALSGARTAGLAPPRELACFHRVHGTRERGDAPGLNREFRS